MTNNRSKLFNALKNDGYDNFNNEDEFNQYVDNAENRNKLFNALQEEGYDNFKSADELSEYLGYQTFTTEEGLPYESFTEKVQYTPEEEKAFEERVKQFKKSNEPLNKDMKAFIESRPELGENVMHDWGQNNYNVAEPIKDEEGNEYYPLKPEKVARREYEHSITPVEEQLNNRLAENEKKLAEARKRSASERASKSNGGKKKYPGMLASVKERQEAYDNNGVSPTRGEIADVDEEVGNLLAEQEYLKEAKKMAEAVKNDAGFFTGMKDAVDASYITFGASDKFNAERVTNIQNKLESGQALTQSEQDLLTSLGLNQMVVQQYNDELGRWYKAGMTTADMAPFMAEMAVSPFSGLGKSAAKFAAKKFGEKGAKAIAAKAISRIAGDVAGAAAMTATTGLASVEADALQRQQGYVTTELGEDGNIVGTGFKGGKDEDTAWREAFTSRAIENWSEMVGNYFAPVGKAVGKVSKKALDAMKLGKVNEFLANINNSQAAKLIDDFTEQTQWNGSIGEFAEEQVGMIADALLVGDTKWSDITDLDQQIDVALGVGVFGTALSLLRMTGYRTPKYRAKKAVLNADRSGLDAYGEELWGKVKEVVDISSDEELSGNLFTLMREIGANEQQQKTAFNYANAIKAQQAVNTIKEKEKIENPNDVSVQTESAYDDGLDANEPYLKHYAKIELDAAEMLLEKDAELMGIVMNGENNPAETINYLIDNGYSEEQVNMAKDYYIAAQRMNGVTDALIDRIDKQVADANAEVDNNTNTDNGNVTQVVLRNGEVGYVVQGNVVQGEKNSVDVNASDKVVFVRMSDGHVHQMNPNKDIQGVAWVDTPQNLKEYNNTTLKQRLLDKEVAEVDWNPNTPNPKVGDTFEYEGQQVAVVGFNNEGMFVAPVEQYQEAVGDEKKMQKLQAQSSQMKPIPVSAYKEWASAQIDSQEAAVKAEQEGVVPSEPVSEQVNEEVNAEVNNPEVTMTPVEESKPQEPVIPTKKDGSIDFVSYGSEGTLRTLAEKYGEKLPNKVSVTAKAYAEDLKKAQQKLQKAEEAYDNAPVGREGNAEKAVEKARQEIETIQREADFWASLDAEVKKAQEEREAIVNPKAEVDMSQEPMSTDEFIAQQLAAGNITLIQDDFMRETGYGEEESKKMNGGANKLFQTKEQGGMSIEAAGERLMEMDREQGTNFFDQSDANAGRDALISFLGSVGSRKDINDYIKNRRAEQARKESEALREQIADDIWNNYHMTPEEYATMLEMERENNPFEGVAKEETDAIFAEAEEEYQSYLKSLENGQGTTEEVAEGSGNVLSEEQTADTTGNQLGEGTEQAGGIGNRSESESETPQESTSGSRNRIGDVFDEARKIALKQKRQQIKERAKAWEKVGVKVRIIERIEDIENSDAIEAIRNGKIVPGWYESSTNEAFIFIPHVRGVKDADMTVIHEAISHRGLRELLGKDKFNELCDKVWEAMPKRSQKEYLSYPGVSSIKDETERKRAAADEYIAHLAETQDLSPKEQSIWNKVVEWFKELFTSTDNKGKAQSILEGSRIGKNEISKLIRLSYAEYLKNGASESAVGEEGTRFRTLEEINQTFNEELQQQIDGTLPNGYIYQLGSPSAVLLSTGMADVPIELNSTRLEDKSKNYGHDYDLSELKDLVKAIHNPMAIFAYGDKNKAQNIIVEIQHEGKNFIVGLSIRPSVGGRVLDINSIRNVFPKDNAEWLNWISQGKMLYADKERIQNLINQQRTNLADVDYLDLDSIANIINSFENPTLPEEKTMFRVAYHGSGAEFDKFDHSFMGTGEGAQAFGWGTYVTEVKDIGERYGTIGLRGKNKFVYKGSQNVNKWVLADAESIMDKAGSYEEAMKRYGRATLAPGTALEEAVNFLKSTKEKDWEGQRHLYEVDIPDNNGTNYLQWNKDYTEKEVADIVKRINDAAGEEFDADYFMDKLEQYQESYNVTGEGIYRLVSKYGFNGNNKAASLLLSDAGFVGMEYPANYYGGGNVDNAKNYVIFNESDLNIVGHTRFRVKDKNELVAVHNISEDNLRKVLSVGGLIMPSIAITKADMGHEGYGEISLLFDKETINPSDRRNKVYGGDAWTPRFPQIVPKISDKVSSNMKKKINGLIEDRKLRDNYSLSAELHPDIIERTITNSGIEGYYNEEWMKLAYLLDNGKKVKIPMKMKDYGDMSETIIEMAKDRGLKVSDIQQSSLDFYNNNKDFVEAIKNIVDERKLSSLPEDKRAVARKLFGEKEMRFAYFDTLISAATRMEYDLEHGGLQEIIDRTALRETIEKKVKTNNADYNKWVDNLFDGIVEKYGIRNDRDWYTPSGNLRPWEQLYDAATPSNILKHMLADNEQGGSGGLWDSNIMGASAESYDSIEEIREKGKKRLKRLTEEEYDEWSNSIANRMSDICYEFLSPSQREEFGASIDAKIEITNAVAKNKSANGIYKYMKALYPKFTMEHANRVEAIVKEIQDFAIGYFEAKPQRIVSLSEVRKAVVPSNVSEDILEGLQNNGIEIATYKKGNEASRKRVIKKESDGIRFRIANQNQEIFVSNAQKAVEGIKQEKATPQQWLAMIEKNGGLKAGEDKWLGLSDWLKASDKKSLTKAEILDFIGENKIRIEEVKYGEGLSDYSNEKLDQFNAEFEELMFEGEEATGSIFASDWVDYAYEAMVDSYGDDFRDAFEVEGTGTASQLVPTLDWNDELSGAARFFLGVEDSVRPINNTRLNYTTEGLENKAEIALTVPTIESWNESDEIHFGDAGEGRAIAWIRFGETTAPQADFEKAARETDEALTAYQNELASKYMKDEGSGDPTEYLDMMSEEEGKKMRELSGKMIDARDAADANQVRVLVIDEIQSKRHQEGREKGYMPIGIRNVQLRMQEIEERLEELGRIESESDFGLTDEQYDEQVLLLAEQKKLVKSGTIPDAPFEKNWSELAMKRMLRYAAENGYDKVAWTTGTQQADRYSLGQVIDEVMSSEWKENQNGWGDGSTDVVKTVYANGADIELQYVVDKNGTIIADINGQHEGRSLGEVFGKDIATKLMADEGTTISNAELRIGGEGMKGFYDKMLPSFVNKYVKKWGTKVQDIELPNVEEAGRIMHSVDVTDAMKESVMEGQTMFRTLNEPAVDYVSQSEGVVSVPRSEVKYTMNNIGNELYKVSGNYLRELYKDGTLGKVLHGEYAEIDQIKAKEDYDKAKEYLGEYLNELEFMKYEATEAAQNVINDVIRDVEYSLDYYRDLALGKDVWRTKESPRFRIVEKHNEDVQKEVDKYMSEYNSKPVSIVEASMTDEELEDIFGGNYSANDIRGYIEYSKTLGGYVETLDKILIFADKIQPTKVKELMFHENIHGLIANGAHKELVDRFYSKAKDAESMSKWKKFSDREETPDNERAEEFFAYAIADAQMRDNFDDVFGNLTSEEQSELKELLNQNGYDYDVRRNRHAYDSEGKNGNVRKSGNLDVSQEAGQEAGAGTSRNVSEGNGEEKREQAERLKNLFDQVADMGLDGVLGNEAYNSTMIKVYAALPDEARKEIINNSFEHYSGDYIPATSDYLIGAKADVFDKVIGFIKDALRKMGFDVNLTPSDVKYLMWRSRKPLNRNNVFDMAEDIDVKRRMGVEDGNTSSTRFRSVYHGSGAEFEKFDHNFMSTGEGEQAYGWGTYVTEVEDIAKNYAAISKKVDVSGRQNAIKSELEKSLGLPEGSIEFADWDSYYENHELKFNPDKSTVDALMKYFGKHKSEWKGLPFNEYDVNNKYDREDFVEATKDSIYDKFKKIGSEQYDKFDAKAPKYLYEVEIPDDNGLNYLSWNDEVQKEKQEELVNAIYDEILYIDMDGAYDNEIDRVELKNDLWRATEKGSELYGWAKSLGGARAASETLREHGYVGIKVPTNNLRDGDKSHWNYVIFDENDLDIKDRTRFRITPEMDAEYLEAVNSGDNKKVAKLVKDAAEVAMRNTKVVDRWGKPKVVYHGTISPERFNEFKGETIFFTSSYADASLYSHKREGGWLSPKQSGRPLSFFLNIENPLVIDAKGRRWSNIPVDWTTQSLTTDDVAQYAKDNGYDGVIINKVKDSIFTDMSAMTVYIAFSSSQIKDAGSTHYYDKAGYGTWRIKDEIGATYDDNGNVIPLSERFNPKENDIRFRITNFDPSDKRDALIKEYDSYLKTGKFNFIEAFQDKMYSLKVLMDKIVEATGKAVRDFEDAYKAENQLGSINKPMMEKYLDKFYKPLLEEVKKLSDKYGREMVERYIYCKSGLERNEVLRQRDADEAYNSSKAELDEKLAKNEIDQAQYNTLLAQVDAQRQKTLSEDVDYSGIRGMLYNVKAQQINDDYESGKIDKATRDQQLAKLEANKKNEVKDWKDFAEKQVAALEGKASTKELDALWNKINAATNETLRMDYESGMIDKGTYDAEKNMMKYYVPLRNWDDTTAEEMYEYRSELVRPVSSNQKRAKGRESQADNPIATIGLMAQNAIVRGNRNMMKQKFYAFVANRETSLATVRDVWYVKNALGDWEAQYADTSSAKNSAEFDAIMQQFEEDMEQLEAQGNAFRGKLPMGMKFRASGRQKQSHVVPVMINGKEYAVYVNGNPRAAQAINGETNAEAFNEKWEWYDKLKRMYGAGLTSWNPDFIIPNMVRDGIHATTMTFIDAGPIAAIKFAFNGPRALAQVYAMITGQGKGFVNPKYQAYFEEFVANGGETGYTAIHTLEDYKKEYEKLINEAKGFSAKKGIKNAISSMGGLLETANRIFEDVNRFNAYVSARESGESIMRSVNAAKNITVNFNRKGAGFANNSAWGTVAGWMSKWILFFNPAVQGIEQLITKSKTNPKRAKATAATILSSGFLMPMLNEMLIAALGDDEEEDNYWNQSDYKRRNNWMLFTGNGYVTIPLPPVLRELYGMGDILYGAITGHITPQRAVMDVARQVQSAIGFFNLIPEVSQEPDMVTYVKGFAPDLFAPALDIVSNTNFMGRPIAKWSDYNKYDPEYERVYKGTSKHWKELSKLLNEIGGNEGRRSDTWGNFINPAMMEHLITSYTGGIGKTINNLAGMATDWVMDDTENIDPYRKSPILPRFYTPVDEKSVVPGINRTFYEFSNQYNIAKKALKNYKDGIKSNEHPEYKKYIDEMKENGEMKFMDYFEKVNKEIKKLEKEREENPNDKKAIDEKIIDLKAKASVKSREILK